MAAELTVHFKDSERNYKQKFLVYEEFSITPNDLVINRCIKEAQEVFQGEPEDIVIRIVMVMQ